MQQAVFDQLTKYPIKDLPQLKESALRDRTTSTMKFSLTILYETLVRNIDRQKRLGEFNISLITEGNIYEQ